MPRLTSDPPNLPPDDGHAPAFSPARFAPPFPEIHHHHRRAWRNAGRAPVAGLCRLHPNGWWRDTAQKLLVLRQDESVVPALRQMARESDEELARLHALWTLEGLGALDATLVRDALRDASPVLRAGALRAGESLFAGESTDLAPLRDELLALAADPDPGVVIQAMMTAHRLDWPGHRERIESLVTGHPSRGVREIGSQLLDPPSPYLTDPRFGEAERKRLASGEVGYRSLCFACHGNEGQGTPAEGLGTTLAPPLAGSPIVLGPPEQSILVLLHGLAASGDERTYPTQMVPMATNSNSWIANVLSYIRNSFGNEAPFVTSAEVDRVRKATQDRSMPPTLEEVKAFPVEK